ncbi:MAG: UDP-glucose 4-epimerase GalE [Saccharospirillaceae bacterium]|nr:UDP-glucose 4-epimerase GalE [Pseudomonadales bacterium]NRB81845.1 UDP-glucose 4-epimerase GalE [Saccharospirillaceae bacterium]
MTVLVTGGAGYIGTHTLVELIAAKKSVLVLDNYCNSSVKSLLKVTEITGVKIPVIEGDINDKECLNNIFTQHDIESVIHFAGLKAVGESCEQPLKYYQNNVAGTLTLCEVMGKYNCKKIVFSSSATVYGDPTTVPITESFPLSTTNPYGASKLMVENILRDLYQSDNSWNIAILRYFNPVGAHQSGLIGEDPNDIPNNLMPFITQVAVGKREFLSVFGDDYDTKDGSGVRDYIHVVDLAKGHLKALGKLEKNIGCVEYNLGTGSGVSVLEMVSAFESVNGQKVPYKITDRRPGDIACCFAQTDFAENELNWKAEKSLSDMMADAWNWQKNNPNGYE